ncbi:hypothetical protein F2981_25340 (plasmid) [Sinorhizobium meliloti]|nr:hypothetical protein [Sinorhizobium meliloti]
MLWSGWRTASSGTGPSRRKSPRNLARRHRQPGVLRRQIGPFHWINFHPPEQGEEPREAREPLCRIGKGGRPGAGSGADAAQPIRRNGHWSEAPVSFDGLPPERIVAGRHLWEHVRQMIDRLPPAQKAVLVMRDVEGQTLRKPAASWTLLPKTQRTLLHRARTRSATRSRRN